MTPYAHMIYLQEYVQVEVIAEVIVVVRANPQQEPRPELSCSIHPVFATYIINGTSEHVRDTIPNRACFQHRCQGRMQEASLQLRAGAFPAHCDLVHF